MQTRMLFRGLVALVTGFLLLAGCSGSDHNDADATFASDMIPHHQQAVVMAQMATSSSADPELLDLAQQIEAAQAPEIDQMTGFLQQWGEDAPTDSMGMGSMPGMMSESDMSELDNATDGEFATMWLTMMIEHHTGAIEMSQTELDDGESSDAQDLAQSIIDGQSAEIEQMQQMLGE